jgi:hypothetical protein
MHEFTQISLSPTPILLRPLEVRSDMGFLPASKLRII